MIFSACLRKRNVLLWRFSWLLLWGHQRVDQRFESIETNCGKIFVDILSINTWTMFQLQMPAVPRLLNRVYDKINNEIANSPIKKMLFRMALNSKEGELRRGVIRRNSLWDKLVFKKVQEAFGGQLRLMVKINLFSNEFLMFTLKIFSRLLEVRL